MKLKVTDNILYRDDLPEIPITSLQAEKLFQLISRYQETPEVQPMILGDGCILCKFKNITIGIETDGYSHS